MDEGEKESLSVFRASSRRRRRRSRCCERGAAVTDRTLELRTYALSVLPTNLAH